LLETSTLRWRTLLMVYHVIPVGADSLLVRSGSLWVTRRRFLCLFRYRHLRLSDVIAVTTDRAPFTVLQFIVGYIAGFIFSGCLMSLFVSVFGLERSLAEEWRWRLGVAWGSLWVVLFFVLVFGLRQVVVSIRTKRDFAGETNSCWTEQHCRFLVNSREEAREVSELLMALRDKRAAVQGLSVDGRDTWMSGRSLGGYYIRFVVFFLGFLGLFGNATYVLLEILRHVRDEKK
jgi:hypothetical protein